MKAEIQYRDRNLPGSRQLLHIGLSQPETGGYKTEAGTLAVESGAACLRINHVALGLSTPPFWVSVLHLEDEIENLQGVFQLRHLVL